MEVKVAGESNEHTNSANKQEPKNVSNIHVSYHFSSRNTTLIKLMIHATNINPAITLTPLQESQPAGPYAAKRNILQENRMKYVCVLGKRVSRPGNHNKKHMEKKCVK
jgi:hypothetical protein